jgi:hypothetical protein
MKAALYVAAAFVVGLGIGKHAQLRTPGDTALLQRCVKDLDRTLELLDLALPPAPQPAGPASSWRPLEAPIIVPALEGNQEGDIT